MSGSIGVKRGSFDALGQGFEFESGEVIFDGGPPDNPRLDVELIADVADIAASVLVTGPAQDPAIELASEPALSRDEILSRLLFGQAQAGFRPRFRLSNWLSRQRRLLESSAVARE